jgi:uncharacterized protein (DUF433 family)
MAQLARKELKIFKPAKCFSFSVTTTQLFASATRGDDHVEGTAGPGLGRADGHQPCPDEPGLLVERKDPDVMGGAPCIRGMRVTVGMIVEAISTVERLLADFTYLEEADIREALAFAGRVAEEREVSGEDPPRVAIAWTESELARLGELLSSDEPQVPTEALVRAVGDSGDHSPS